MSSLRVFITDSYPLCGDLWLMRLLSLWVTECLRIFDQYTKWVKVEPRVMWLPGLHIPESYLTALIQSTCRKNGRHLSSRLGAIYAMTSAFI
ncbi:Dynein heavy chain 10, axonemal [Oopsacas minuta]|uniref:Dynein heavy chain 10, axonemal n=1 Tax=Oopsacas minuta TaxID=111878 RepID=A0AAV7KFJ5_9METZ|nr:Dynein heavy chain 10, axonemal [Oopsacas minuta]